MADDPDFLADNTTEAEEISNVLEKTCPYNKRCSRTGRPYKATPVTLTHTQWAEIAVECHNLVDIAWSQKCNALANQILDLQNLIASEIPEARKALDDFRIQMANLDREAAEHLNRLMA
jgi:hypothetical protein